LAVEYAEVDQKVRFIDGDFIKDINQGVKVAYR